MTGNKVYIDLSTGQAMTYKDTLIASQLYALFQDEFIDKLADAIVKKIGERNKDGMSENLQPLCNQVATDLISRQAAISAVNTALFPKINTAKDAEKALLNLPSAQRWIPLSERLPDTEDNVLITYKIKNIRYVSIGSMFGDGEFHGYDDEYLSPEGRKRKAIAWMPLPKPYERKEL